MNTSSAGLDPAFIERQRQRLTELRQTLLTAARNGENEEAGVKRDSTGGPREYEDDAQKLALLETDGILLARALERLTRVDRALRKIADGTYGFSDLSGQAIPRERLVTVPEAICMLDEEQALERGAR